MGLYRRGKIWWMSFVHEGRQVRVSTGTSDRRKAEEVLGEVRRQVRDRRYRVTLEEQHRTFGDLMDRFLGEHVIRKASQRSMRGHVNHLRAFFGDATLLADITPRLVVEYKNRRYQDGVSPATVNRALATLKKAFNLAVREWEWCHRNPVLSVSMEREHNARDRWLSLEEEDRLLAACAPWLRDLVTFALNTGMRMGEILALTWQGVDLTRRTVTVFRSKNGERRTIPMNQKVFALLTEKAKVRSIQTNLVFPSKTQTLLESGHLRRSFRLALKKAGIMDFHFHDLRHTFATRLVQAGVELYKVQRLLGHKSPIMTQRYAHHYPESLRDGVETLDRPWPVSQSITVRPGGRVAEAV